MPIFRRSTCDSGGLLKDAMSKYSEKLKDPRWQRAKATTMLRDDFTCRACGCNTRQLQVHHMAYVGDPWEAPPEALVTLCDSCHGVYHSGPNGARVVTASIGRQATELETAKVERDQWRKMFDAILFGHSGADEYVAKIRKVAEVAFEGYDAGRPPPQYIEEAWRELTKLKTELKAQLLREAA
jgi:hypothetical protein